MKLVITLATRGRPQQLLNTINRSIANLVLPNTIFMVQVDSDDKETIEALEKAPLDPRVVVNIREREDTIAEKWNRAMSEPADVYFTQADDDPYMTPGYDVVALKAAETFPDGIGMVYGYMANASFSSVVAPTAKLVEKMGYIFPPYFPYWFVDHWTDDVSKLIGRTIFADIRTDQSAAGKTQELREPGWWATWFDAAYLIRRKQARDIIESTDYDAPSWLKTQLLSNHHFVEHRSHWINDNVRQNAAALEGMSRLTLGDPRYQRIRKRAVDMIPQLLEGMSVAEAAAYKNTLLPPTSVVGLRRAFA